MEKINRGSLSEEELRRYNRHIILPEIRREGQEKLRGSSVLITGAGGLGSPVALYLAAAGVGVIGIADGDRVALENLQRQIIHTIKDIEKPKTESARDKIALLNPGVQIHVYPENLTRENAPAIIAPYDVIIDATDRLTAKFLLNEVCVREGKPLSHAGVRGFSGQAATVVPGRGPCLRCIFRDIPPAESLPVGTNVGVFGPVPGILGSIQAAETLKLLMGIGSPLVGRLLTFDALGMDMRIIPFDRNPRCPACGNARD